MTGLSVPKRDLGIVIVASVVNKTLKNFKGELNDNKAVINIGNFVRELQDTANGFSSRYHKGKGAEPVLTKEELISIVMGTEFSSFFESVNDKEVIIRAKPREYETALKKLVLDSTMRYSEALISQINAMGREYREVKENQRETQKKQSEELKSEKNNEEDDEELGETRDVEDEDDDEQKGDIESESEEKDGVSGSKAVVAEDQTKTEEPETEEAAEKMDIDEEEKSDSEKSSENHPVEKEMAQESEGEQDKEEQEKIEIDKKREAVDVKEEDEENSKEENEEENDESNDGSNDESNEEQEMNDNEEENEQEVDSEDNKENDENDDSKQSSLEPSVESETPAPKSEPDLTRLFTRTTRSTPEPSGRKRSGSPYTSSSSQHKRFQNIAVNLINSIQAHRYSSPFLQAVNKRDAVDYYDVIYQPKNLKGILKAVKSKAKDPEYRSVKQLERDIMLMFANCVMYNKSDEDLVQLTISMKNDVNNIFKMFEEAESDIK